MTVCNQSPPRLPKVHHQESLTLHWRSFSGSGRAHGCIRFDHSGGHYIKNKQWHTNVNISRLTVLYLNATMNSETRNPQLEIGTDGSPLAKPGNTPDWQVWILDWPVPESGCRAVGPVWNRTDTYLRTTSGPLAGYPDPLLSLDTLHQLETYSSFLDTRPGFLASTCKEFELWLCQPMAGGRGGSGLGQQSGMPRECTWIMEGRRHIPKVAVLHTFKYLEVLLWTIYRPVTGLFGHCSK